MTGQFRATQIAGDAAGCLTVLADHSPMLTSLTAWLAGCY